MTTTKHTKGPWFRTTQNRVVVNVPGDETQHLAAITTVGDALMPGEGEANARRIVACVNACEGISDDELNETDIKGALDQRDEYKQQRDELLEALQLAQPIIEARALDGPNGNSVAEQARDVIRAALAKAGA